MTDETDAYDKLHATKKVVTTPKIDLEMSLKNTYYSSDSIITSG